MGIGSVTSTNSMSSMRMLSTVPTDSKSKNIQNEITNAKQQMQKISPKEELSVSEKEIERNKLQKEISSLNIELKQHQETLRKSQRREIMMAELQEDQEPVKAEKSEDKKQTAQTPSDKVDEKNPSTDEQQTGRPGTVLVNNSDGTVILKGTISQDENPGVDAEETRATEVNGKGITEKESKTVEGDTAKDASLSHKKIYAIVSADSSVQQANRQGAIIAKTRDGIAILKSEINQDEKLGIDTEKKQAELEKMEKKEQRAISFQSSILGEANKSMKSATETNVTGINNKTQIHAGNNAFINAINVSQETTQAAQQNFHISFS